MHNQAENLGLNQHIHSFMQYLKHSVSECVFIKENKKRKMLKCLFSAGLKISPLQVVKSHFKLLSLQNARTRFSVNSI